jgi:hypothetical protein
MADKKVSFVEAIVAHNLGEEIYGKYSIYGHIPSMEVNTWNPSNQTVVSWKAITEGDWYIKDKGESDDE